MKSYVIGILFSFLLTACSSFGGSKAYSPAIASLPTGSMVDSMLVGNVVFLEDDQGDITTTQFWTFPQGCVTPPGGSITGGQTTSLSIKTSCLNSKGTRILIGPMLVKYDCAMNINKYRVRVRKKDTGWDTTCQFVNNTFIYFVGIRDTTKNKY